MFNHHRGLWGYTGLAPDGGPMTVQSSGIGGPSAAIVIAELANLGARWLLRVGTCGAIDASLALGELMIVTEAIPDDGTSRALGATGPLRPSPELLEALRAAGQGARAADRPRAGPVASTDLFYDGPSEQEQRWLAAGAVAVEMETATLFALAAARGLKAASLLLVTDLLLPSRIRIDPDALTAGEHRLGELAVSAFSTATEASAVQG